MQPQISDDENPANLSASPFQRLSVFTFLSINFFQSIPCNS